MGFGKKSNVVRILAAAVLVFTVIGSACSTGIALADDLTYLDDLNAGAAKVLAESADGNVRAGASEYLDSQAKKAVAGAKELVSANKAELVESVSQDQVEETQGDDTDWSNMVLANVNEFLNVRAEADENSELVGKFYKDCAGEVLEQKGEWTKIRSGELEGWAKNDYLFIGEEAEEEAKEVGKLMATIEADTLRIRKEADENSGVYGLLASGEEVEAIEEVGDWVKVKYSDDSTGYVSKEYVSVEYQFEEGETMDEINAREEAKKAERAKVEASRTSQTSVTNTGAVAAGVDDVTLLAALIQCESGWECYEGKVAVGAAVVNRAKGRYGSIFNAIYAPGQFGPAGSGKVAAVVAMGPSPTCIQAATDAISGVSNIGAATHFRNIRSGYPGIVIGNHVFW